MTASPPELINVIVPTRERADTLLHCLETVVAQDCDRLKVWVSDNASSPATREVVESFNDSRINYVNTGERLSMAKNYEFALSQVESGWMVMLGDDDGLMPGALEPAVAQLEASGLKAMSSETCFYNWPKAAPDRPERLTVPLEKDLIEVASDDAVDDILQLVRPKARLPQTYTGGIVHHDVYRAAKAPKGTFFQSQIPDIYSSFAITATVDRYLYSKVPFAIAGRSSHSIGQSLFKMEKNAFLDEGLIPFHADFPPSDVGTLAFSMPAIQFECYTQSLFLRRGEPVITRQRMLEVILANTQIGEEHIANWGRVFAAQHGLDYAAAVARVPAVRRRTRIVDGWRSLKNLTECARLFAGDPVPLANVREASETAAAILRDPPNRVSSSLRTLVKRYIRA
jgi:hypothetical protein